VNPENDLGSAHFKLFIESGNDGLGVIYAFI